MQFCEIDDLANESDVEQKLLWPLLTSERPLGLGFSAAEVQTKPNLRDLAIDKGTSKKIYRPDFAIIQSGLPMAVGEAKKPGESLIEAKREARLYAAEVNALYKTEFNPCRYVFACDGRHLIFSKWDSTIPFAELKFDDIIPTNPKFADLVAIIGKTALTNEADALLRSLTNDADMFRREHPCFRLVQFL